MKLSTYAHSTGNSWWSASQSAPCGTLSSSTMIVIRIASTPSLKASSRPLRIIGFPSLPGRAGQRQIRAQPAGRRSVTRVSHTRTALSGALGQAFFHAPEGRGTVPERPWKLAGYELGPSLGGVDVYYSNRFGDPGLDRRSRG